MQLIRDTAGYPDLIATMHQEPAMLNLSIKPTYLDRDLALSVRIQLWDPFQRPPRDSLPTSERLCRLASWVASHGLRTPVRVVDGQVLFTCHDGQEHKVRTLAEAREILGY